MNHAVVVAWTAENRVAKYQPYDTMADCRAHRARILARWPDAFIAEAPNAPVNDWLVDPVAKTISVSPLPQRKPEPSEMAILAHALKRKGTVTRADLDQAKADLMK